MFLIQDHGVPVDVLPETVYTMETKRPASVDEYIAAFPAGVQVILEQVRATIKKAAPGAEERISYSMPAFTLHGRNLVYFAAFENHIGFYPAPVGIEEFRKEFSAYKFGKGSVQFPLDKPMPLDLITRIVKFRAKENLEKSAKKKNNRV